MPLGDRDINLALLHNAHDAVVDAISILDMGEEPTIDVMVIVALSTARGMIDTVRASMIESKEDPGEGIPF